MDKVNYRGYEIHKAENKGKYKSVIMKDDTLIHIINSLNKQVAINAAKDYIDNLIYGDDYAE